MPIPGSVLSNVMPFGIEAAESVYPSSATFLEPAVNKMSSGQSFNTFIESPNAGLRDLACRRTPLILIRAQEQEHKRLNVKEIDAKFQVNFNVMLPVPNEELLLHKVRVDGLDYNVLSVENDGNGLTTRIIVSSSIPSSE